MTRRRPANLLAELDNLRDDFDRKVDAARSEMRRLAGADDNQIIMSYSISTLLTCNLQDVFGENDPARLRAAIDEIFTEDGVFYDPSRGA